MHLGNSKLKVIGIDIAENGDISVKTEGYFKDGILYITKVEELKED